MIWICFAATAAVIILAGSRLSVFADQLAGLLKLSRSAVGILMVSLVTTLPELSTTLGAIVKVGQPDLAIGNNLGSVLFNLIIIAVCDLVFRKGGILRQAHQTAPMLQSLIMLILALLTLSLPNSLSLNGLNFAAGSPVIIAVYIIIFLTVHRTGRRETGPQEENSGTAGKSPALSKALTGFLISAVIVVCCGIILAGLGDRIAAETGLGRSFVGTLFLAAATSLPELTVGITSVRIGAYDMMIGNIAGANMLNVLVIAVADLIYKKEALHIPGNLSRSQLLTGGCAAAVTLLAMLAMRQKEKSKTGVSWESPVMLLIYLASLFALYKGVLS